MPPTNTRSGSVPHIYQRPFEPNHSNTLGQCCQQRVPPPLPTTQPPSAICIYESTLNNYLVLGQQSNNRLSNEISYAQRSGTCSAADRRSFMRLQNEFSPMQNDLATSLMGSSNDSREDPNRCFQPLCPQGRRPSRQKTPPIGPFSRLFNEKTAVIYFVFLLLLLALSTGFLFLKTTKQYVYVDSDLISDASPEHALEFGLPADFILPSRQIAYFELPIQHNTNLALLFNVSDPQSRFVVYARQSLPPTPTAYSYRRIVTVEHVHHRPLQSKIRRSVGSDDSRQFFEETQVRNSLITLEDLQAGKWFFGFLNDNIRPLQIRLIPVAIPKTDHHLTTTIHGCKFDCFGKGTCVKNQCVCYPGYTGKFCQETLCPVLCSGNGVFSNGICHCHSNFKGSVCDETVSGCPNGRCETIESRVPEALNANKPLTDTTMPEQQSPTVAIQPEPPISSNDDAKAVDQHKCQENCNGHGDCLNNACVCQSGWTGETCATSACENNCNSNGECQMIGDEYKCFCNSSHFGQNCEYPLESECSDGVDNDEDGLIDCADSECCSSPTCSNHPLCISDLERFVVPTTSPTRPETSFRRQIEFLLGPDSSQKYADLNAFDNSRISVIRGHILSKKAGPLTGVRISNLLSPKQGFTLTRSSNGGGFFHFVCNGGSFVRLSLLRHPFGAVERSFFVAANQIVDVGQIFLDKEEVIINSTNLNEQCRSVQIAHKFRPKLMTAPISSDNFNLKAQDGSRLDFEKQSLGVRSTIEATNDIQLVYNSDRSPQAQSALYINLLDTSLSQNLQNVHLKIKIAGRVYEQKFKPKAHLQYTFLWDRRNVFGQDVVGLQNAIVEITYEYKDGCKVEFMDIAQLEGRYLLNTPDFGQWTLNIQHFFNSHNQILERGDGQRVYLERAPPVVRTLIGNQNQRSENCPECHNQPANNVSLYAPGSIVSLPDGSIVFGDYNLIRRISANGQKTEILLELSTENAGKYQLALDAANNEVYVALQYQILKLKRLEKVRDPKTNQRIVAGTGEQCETETGCSTGDNKAKSAKFHQVEGMSFDKNSGFYLLDSRSIHYINRHGELQNLVSASDWSWKHELQCPSSFRLELLNLQEPRFLIVEPLTQDLFVLDRNAIYRINVQQSVVQLVVGKPHTCNQMYDDRDENLQNPRQIAFDPQTNFIYLTESDGKQMHRIRRVSANGGKLEDFAGRTGLCDCNRLSCPCDMQLDRPTEPAANSLFHNLSGINIDQRGRILVSDTGNFKIKVLESKQQKFNQRLGTYHIHSPNTNEVYEFDRSGRHLQTRNLFDDQSKYLFSYSTSDGRLANTKMHQMNVTFSAQDSNILVRTSQSQETTIQMNAANEQEYQQVYAISTWRGFSGMFEYGSGQLISKTKIGQKITQIAYDQNGRVSAIEEVNGDKKVEVRTPTFTQYRNIPKSEEYNLRMPLSLNENGVGAVRESATDLIVNLPAYKKFSKRSNGFDLQEHGFHRIYEHENYPFSSPNHSFTISHKLVFPEPERDMPKLVLRYDLQTSRQQSKTQQTVKLNGQKFVSRTFDSNSMTLTLRDPSDNALFSLQMDPDNRLTSVQFGSDPNNNATVSYNGVGQIERLNWLDRSLLYFYDEQHRLTRQVVKGDDTELVRSFQYDSNSPYPTTIRIENGAEYTLKYEPNGHLQSVQAPSGNQHTFSRQGDQEIQRTLPSGAHIKAVYGLSGQLQKFVPFTDTSNQAQWTKDDFGRMQSSNISTAKFVYRYTDNIKSELNGAESDHILGYYTNGPLLRGIRQSFGGEVHGAKYFCVSLYTYDDSGRMTQATTHFAPTKLEISTNYAYDFMGRLTKINNAMIIRKEHAIQIIHPNFEMLFTYTLDNQLSGITFTGTNSQTRIGGQFVHNSLSLLNSTLWQMNGETEEVQTFGYNNGKLSTFALDGKEETVEYGEDGFASKTGATNIENEDVSKNELGWTVEQDDFSYTYDALGQLIQFTNKQDNVTFYYIYNYHQQLVQRRTFSPGQTNITFYYGTSNEPHRLSLFTFDDQIFYAIHYVEDRPFLLEQVNGSSFALLTDSYGSVRRVISNSGSVVESRSYGPFGYANVTKKWLTHLPIGYMGFIEDNGLVFVYDKENQVTRPLNSKTGRFMSSSHTALKSKFDAMNPDLELDLFNFDHGRSLPQLFPTNKKQWLQLAGIPPNQFAIQDNSDCNSLVSLNSVCSAKQTFNFFDQLFNHNNPIPSFQLHVPVLF